MCTCRRVGDRLCHRWCRAYDRHGRHRSASAAAARGDGVGAEALERVAHAEVGRHEHVGVAERAHRDVLRGPRPDAGQLLQCRRQLVPVGAGVESIAPSAIAAHAATSDRPRARGHRQRRRVEARPVAAADGNSSAALSVRHHRRAAGSRIADRGASRPATVGRPGDRHLLADDRPHEELGAVDDARRAQARAACGRAGRARIGAELMVDATGSASRSSSRRHRCTAVCRSASAASRSVHDTAPVERWQRDDARAVGQAKRAAVTSRRPTTRRPARRERRGTRTASRDRTARATGRRTVIEPDVGSLSRRAAARRGPPATLRAQSVGDVANTSRTVSLNWRTLAKPAANATSVIGIVVVSISSRAVCARCARAMASGPAPSSSVISRLRWRSL